jgi:hypothetical protein
MAGAVVEALEHTKGQCRAACRSMTGQGSITVSFAKHFCMHNGGGPDLEVVWGR